MSYELLKNDNVSLKVSSVRQAYDLWMVNVTVWDVEKQRTFEDFYVAPLDTSLVKVLDDAKDKAIRQYFGHTVAVINVDNSVDKVVLEAGSSVEVEVDKVTTKEEAKPKPVKKKARRTRKKKVATDAKPAEEFKEDPVLEVIVPKVCYDPENEAHRKVLGDYLKERYGDWKNDAGLKKKILGAVAVLKQTKCLEEGTNAIGPEMDDFWNNFGAE